MSCERIEFRWQARFTMAGWVPGIVVDSFENGCGALHARLLGLFPVAHARGPEVDRSEIQRYLAEIAWCPMALTTNPQLEFKELSSESIRIKACNDQTYVDLSFDQQGDIEGARTLTRYRGSSVEPWAGRFAGYRIFDGVRVPTSAEVWWHGNEGRFVYWRATITAFERLTADSSPDNPPP